MKCEKWTDQHDMSVGQRKILSPRQESNLPNTGRALYPLSYDNSRRAKSFNWSLYVTGVLHTARISIVEVIVSVIKLLSGT